MKRPNQLSILFLLLGIIATLFLIARTDLFSPVMQFILATDQGTPLQLAGCVIGAIAGFRIIYLLLNMVGSYYSRQLDVIQEEKAAQIQK